MSSANSLRAFFIYVEFNKRQYAKNALQNVYMAFFADI